MVGLLKTVIQQQYLRGKCGLAIITAAALVVVVLLPAGTRMCLTYETIIMDFSSSRPFLCFSLLNICENSLNNRSTSYLQFYELI